MNATEVNTPRRRGLAAALALTSFALPAAYFIPIFQSTMPTGSPPSVSKYGVTIVALVLGIACAVSTFALNRSIAPAWFRWLCVALAGLGALLAAYLLFALVGTCGLDVLVGACNA